MRSLAIILLALTTSAANAQTPDCRTIKDNQARLECYDKMAPSKPAAPKPAAPKQHAAAPAGESLTVGSWELRRKKDAMTDKVSCTIFAVGKPYVQVSANDLYIGYGGRGGVQGFQYRIDDQPASGMQLPSPTEKQIGAVHIGSSTFQQIVRARRLRVSTLTMVAGIKEEDIALDGLAALHARLMRECP